MPQTMKTKIDDQKILAYYGEKIREHGFTAKGMDWKNAEAQQLRFGVFCKYMQGARPSVLDVGCGNGEFLSYCKTQGLLIDYLGLDISRAMVDACNAKHGNDSAIVGVITQLPIDRQFDYVIASGTFNARLDHDEATWHAYVMENLNAMFAHCKVAAMVNLMSEFVDYRYDRLYYPTLAEVAKYIAQNLSRTFVIDHAYYPYEATFICYRTSLAVGGKK